MKKTNRYAGKKRIAMIVTETQGAQLEEGAKKMKVNTKKYIVGMVARGIQATNQFKNIMEDLAVPSDLCQSKWRKEREDEIMNEITGKLNG